MKHDGQPVRHPQATGRNRRNKSDKRPHRQPEFGSRTWIPTYTGRPFWPLNASTGDVHIEDIAHHLSQICRWSGATKQFYSVAQHSVLVSMICDNARCGLLHDAPEAYLGDVPPQMKRLWLGFEEVEGRLYEIIATKFDLPRQIPDDVKHADLVMRETERRDLIRAGAACELIWPRTGVAPINWGRITPWPPAEAERNFLLRFRQLFE